MWPTCTSRNVNHTLWKIILIVVLKDKQERREGYFTADLAVNLFSTTTAGLVSCKIYLFNYRICSQ